MPDRIPLSEYRQWYERELRDYIRARQAERADLLANTPAVSGDGFGGWDNSTAQTPTQSDPTRQVQFFRYQPPQIQINRSPEQWEPVPSMPVVQGVSTGRIQDSLQGQSWAQELANYVVPVSTSTPEPFLPMENDMPQSKLANTFLVGCDPEMVLVKNGTIVNVSDKMGAQGEVGWDHGGNVVELRPRPAKSTFTLTKRIHTLLKEHPKLVQFQSEKWKSGAFFQSKPSLVGRSTVSLGGHVHLDIKAENPGQSRHWYNEKQYVPALDRVTKYYEHLDLLPKTEAENRRNFGDYGHYGDIRVNEGRIEYRTMPSWLYSPGTTLLCLTGAKLAGVDPELCLDTLKLKNITFNNLVEWFGHFKDKDADAARVCEDLLAKGQKDLIADPDNDVKGVWR